MLIYIWLGVFSSLVYLELLLGATNSIDINRYWVHNIIICYLIVIFFFNIIKKRITLFAFSMIAFIWSVVSHFVLQLHGSALCFTLFKNFNTAVTVLDNYHLSVDARTFLLLLVFIINTAIVYFFPKSVLNEYCNTRIGLVFKISFLVLASVYAYFSYSIALINVSWAPFFIIEQRGYCSYLITDSIYCFEHIRKPDGYDEKLIPTDLSGWDDNTSDVYPDIIVILNETFSDITKYSSIKTDKDPFEELAYINDLYMGYCITPYEGGGTNQSEYELLSSNSSALLTMEAPFNYIDFSKHSESAVSYLKKYNYSTYAFHCFSKENYNRKYAYPGLGFDNVYLGADEFEYHNKNGNRDWLDEDNYKDLIRIYNESSESPKFMYLLTYQNHGGYEQNPDEMDTIHSQGEYAISNAIIDEYESSVALSAHAFKELTDYFSSVTRPVIICMVGDHTLSYSELINTVSATKEEKEIDNRTVPYLVWANYPIKGDVFTQYTSMTDLLPSVIYSAGIELDDYYKQIMNIHEMMPGKTSFGTYIDNNGAIGNVLDNEEINTEWNKYLYSEYKRLSK